jgi:hypothetical protein
VDAAAAAAAALRTSVDAMDPRRGRTTVPGPKVRQVGFVTPNTDIPGDAASVGADKEVLGLTTNSPSPVIIPPTRPALEIPLKTEPVPVPSPSHRRANDVEIPSALPASYNPNDSVLEGSSLPSSKGGSLFPPFSNIKTMSTIFANSYCFHFANCALNTCISTGNVTSKFEEILMNLFYYVLVSMKGCDNVTCATYNSTVALLP